MKRTELNRFVKYNIIQAEIGNGATIADERDKIILLKLKRRAITVEITNCINCEILITGVGGELFIPRFNDKSESTSLTIDNPLGRVYFTNCDLSLITAKAKSLELKNCFGSSENLTVEDKITLQSDVANIKAHNYYTGIPCTELISQSYNHEPITNNYITSLLLFSSPIDSVKKLADINCARLEFLTIIGPGIISRQFKEQFSCLRNLVIRRYTFEDTFISMPNSLIMLHLTDCNLNDVTIDSKNLEKLIIRDQTLKALNLVHGSKLMHLDLKYCKLTAPPIIHNDDKSIGTRRKILLQENPLQYPDGNIYDFKKDKFREFLNEWEIYRNTLNKKSAYSAI